METRDLSYKPSRYRRFRNWFYDYRTWERIGYFCWGMAAVVFIVCIGAMF